MARRRAKQRRLQASFGWKYHAPRALYDFSSLVKVAVRMMRMLRERIISASKLVEPIVEKMIERQREACAHAGRTITLSAAKMLDSDDVES